MNEGTDARGCSSVGRAPPRQGGGREFEARLLHGMLSGETPNFASLGVGSNSLAFHVTINELDALAIKHDTDKRSDRHNYVPLYDQLFAPLRDQPITLLEFGVAWGGSMRTWRDYFPQANIIGVDLFLECATTPKALADVDVHLFQVDQNDPQLPELVQQWCPLNIVIDDCSHIPEKTLASFKLMWPLIPVGGIYAIEDLGIHDHPYDDLLDEIRGFDDVRMGVYNSQHPDVPWWEIAVIIKGGDQPLPTPI